MPQLTVTITQNVHPEAVADLFITAFEGGSNYWLETFQSESNFNVKDKESWLDFLLKDKAIRFEFQVKDEEVATHKVIDYRDLSRALSRTVNKRRLRLDEQGLFEDYDAWDADYFLQELLLGEQVYG